MRMVALDGEFIVSLNDEDIDCLKYCLRNTKPMGDKTLSYDAQCNLETRRWSLLTTLANIKYLYSENT